MSKLGGVDYPGDLAPHEAELWMETLLMEFNGSTGNKEAFAKAVGHKSTSSGTFRRKLADARKYDLMTPRGDLEITPLGKRLADAETSQERMSAYLTMLRQIPLIRKIRSKLDGADPSENDDDEFSDALQAITDADPSPEVSRWIKSLYSTMMEAEKAVEDQPEIDLESAEEAHNDDWSATKIAQSDPDEEHSSAILLRVGHDELRFEELNDTNIEIAKQFLESKKGNDGSVQMRFS